MKTILVITKQTELAATIVALLEREHYRVIPRGSLDEAEPLLRQGFFDGCVLDAEVNSAQPCRVMELVRRLAALCPVLVYTAAGQPQFEEDVYSSGAAHVLMKPVRGPLLCTLLARLTLPPPPPAERTQAGLKGGDLPRGDALGDLRQSLVLLRNFSGILSLGLCGDALLRQFLLFLRQILGVNRAGIFLRTPSRSLGDGEATVEDRGLHPVCTMGLAPVLLDNLNLTLEEGLGGYLLLKGRILRRESEEIRGDHESQRQFELLGAQVAIPILDRESLMGMAVFDGHLTGEPLTNDELALVFHLLEQLGLAIRNSWLHDELAASHEMMTNVLSQLPCGCLVINHQLEVIHSNRAAQSLLASDSTAPLAFNDLPPTLGGKVYEALTNGQETSALLYRAPGDSSRAFRATITPFCPDQPTSAKSVLLVVEDCTTHERSRVLEIESANLRLLKTMAEQMAHEIGNSLVPLSTHQQLLAHRIDDPEFQLSLGKTLTEGVNRISRLAKQMMFLAQDIALGNETIPAAKLLEEAFAEAQKHYLPRTARLLPELGGDTPFVVGNRHSLKHALAEVILNAFQANPTDPVAIVRVRQDQDEQQQPWIHFEVEDSGPGFAPEIVDKVPQPFLSTRSVGLGLGLTVTQKIVEAHHGKVRLLTNGSRSHGIVRLSLPASVPSQG